MSRRETCRTCHYWDMSAEITPDNDYGWCRFNAPTSHKQINAEPSHIVCPFPITSLVDWCRNWAANIEYLQRQAEDD